MAYQAVDSDESLPSLNFGDNARTPSPDVEELDPESDYPKWEDLPAIPIIRIYKHLKYKDRAAMSMVCRSWSVLFDDPSLWRDMEFRYCPNQNVKKINSHIMARAQRVGQYTRKFRMYLSFPNATKCKKFAETFRELSALLTYKKCQLKAFVYTYMRADQHWKNVVLRDIVVTSLCRFVRQQERIQRVNMCYAFLNRVDGMLLLISLLTGMNKAREKQMRIVDFFERGSEILYPGPYVRVMCSFHNIRVLHMNYNGFNEEILLGLIENSSTTLRDLYIKVSNTDPHDHMISQETWRKFTRHCPGVFVRFGCENVSYYEHLQTILVHGMPMKQLEIFTGYQNSMQMATSELGRTVRHIGHAFGSTLYECNLFLENTEEVLDESFHAMFQECRVLVKCEIHANVTVAMIDWLCTMRLCDKIHCKLIDMIMFNKTHVQVYEILALEQMYKEALKVYGYRYTFRGAIA